MTVQRIQLDRLDRASRQDAMNCAEFEKLVLGSSQAPPNHASITRRSPPSLTQPQPGCQLGAGWSQYAIRVPAAFVSLVPFAVSKRSFASFDPRADRQGVDLPVWCQKRKRAETMHCCGNRSQVDHHGPRSCSRHQQVFWQLSSLAEIAHDFGQGPQSAA